MRSHTSVLLDFDGVLVDNVAFEHGVTDYIVDRLASKLVVSPEQAALVWRQELHESQGHPQWYDYDFHCHRLDLPDLAREAHEASLPLLKPIYEADKTLAMLAEADMQVGIATDSMPWVIDFKIAAMEFSTPAFVMSSEPAGASKSSPRYWEYFRRVFPNETACIFVDNRLINLDTAGKAFPNMGLICFVGDEHVLSLSGIIEPNRFDAPALENPVTVVADHDELMECIIDLLVAGPRELA